MSNALAKTLVVFGTSANSCIEFQQHYPYCLAFSLPCNRYCAGSEPFEGLGPNEAVPVPVPVPVLVFCFFELVVWVGSVDFEADREGVVVAWFGLVVGLFGLVVRAGAEFVGLEGAADCVGFFDTGLDFFGLGSPLSPGLPLPGLTPFGGLKPLGSLLFGTPLMMPKTFERPSGTPSVPQGLSQLLNASAASDAAS